MTAATEADILRPIIERLQNEDGAEVYQEVPFEGQRFDLVVDHPFANVLKVFHGKRELSDSVMDQAWLSAGVADQTIVVVPWPARPSKQFIQRKAKLAQEGIGLMMVGSHGRTRLDPTPRTSFDAQPDRLRAVLRQQQQVRGTAGSPNDYSTPLRDWFADLEAMLDTGPVFTPTMLRIIGGYPNGGHQAAMKEIRRRINSGRLNAEISGLYIRRAQ